MPEDILKHKVATAVAEDERQHMGELLRIIEENDTRDQEEAESTAEEERKERKQDREIERAVDEYIEDCAEGSDFYNFDDNSDEANCMDEDEK
jgi:rubrerythrin